MVKALRTTFQHLLLRASMMFVGRLRSVECVRVNRGEGCESCGVLSRGETHRLPPQSESRRPKFEVPRRQALCLTIPRCKTADILISNAS